MCIISLLSNQVEEEMKSGVSGWPANVASIFSCFPSWGISVSNNIGTCMYMY